MPASIIAEAKYSTGNKWEFWQTEPDAVQGGECAAVRALQAGANAATRRFWQPKTHVFLGEYFMRLPQVETSIIPFSVVYQTTQQIRRIRCNISSCHSW
jgi:hypothetical protein